VEADALDQSYLIIKEEIRAHQTLSLVHRIQLLVALEFQHSPLFNCEQSTLGEGDVISGLLEGKINAINLIHLPTIFLGMFF
jgi:hypothetical protein